MDVQINAALNGIKNLRASVSNIFEVSKESISQDFCEFKVYRFISDRNHHRW